MTRTMKQVVVVGDLGASLSEVATCFLVAPFFGVPFAFGEAVLRAEFRAGFLAELALALALAAAAFVFCCFAFIAFFIALRLGAALVALILATVFAMDPTRPAGTQRDAQTMRCDDVTRLTVVKQ